MIAHKSATATISVTEQAWEAISGAYDLQVHVAPM
jgi:hypothetical protein